MNISQQNDEINRSQEKSKNKILTYEAFILAGIPIFLYLIFSIYKIGYLSYFNIPRDFFSISISEVYKNFHDFFFGSHLISILFILSSWLIVIGFDLHIKYIKYFLPLLLLLIYQFQRLDLFLRIGGIKYIIEIVFVLILLFIIYLYFPKKNYREAKGLINKTKLRMKRYQELSEKANLVEKILLTVPIILTVFLYSYNFVFSLGYVSAIRQTGFFVADKEPECIVLLFKDDLALCYPFDREEKTIENNFLILNLKENNNLHFYYEEIGGLNIIHDRFSLW